MLRTKLLFLFVPVCFTVHCSSFLTASWAESCSKRDAMGTTSHPMTGEQQSSILYWTLAFRQVHMPRFPSLNFLSPNTPHFNCSVPLKLQNVLKPMKYNVHFKHLLTPKWLNRSDFNRRYFAKKFHKSNMFKAWYLFTKYQEKCTFHIYRKITWKCPHSDIQNQVNIKPWRKKKARLL